MPGLYHYSNAMDSNTDMSQWCRYRVLGFGFVQLYSYVLQVLQKVSFMFAKTQVNTLQTFCIGILLFVEMTHFVDESDPNYNFKGWRLYFNSYTLRGRFNVSIL